MQLNFLTEVLSQRLADESFLRMLQTSTLMDRKKLKMGLTVLATCLVGMSLTTVLFIKVSPQFGAPAKAKQTNRVLNSPNFKDGKFHNLSDTAMMTGFKFESIYGWIFDGNKVPSNPLPVIKIDTAGQISESDSITKVTWLGHSAVLLEIGGQKILLDLMLGDVVGPHKWLGTKRFDTNHSINIDDLPNVDAVLISHDHYDHLEYSTIVKLKSKSVKFCVPLGVGAHLIEWGVEENNIIEFDWWESIDLNGLTIVSTPARHFSGRGIIDRNTTLWGSWVIKSETASVYFSGDTGYGKHFKEIGEAYGPFDLTMLDCGQYNDQWAYVHMFPEEAVQANLDLKGKRVMPIHWGAFKLSLHPWNDPALRIRKRADELEVAVTIPQIGEPVILGKPHQNQPWME